jgi:hypothetical protein
MMSTYPAKGGTSWSAADDDDLRTAIAGGATVDDAADFLCLLPNAG